MPFSNVQAFTPPPVKENKEKKKEKKESVKIRISVFFDGTLNNRENIHTRLLVTPEYKLHEDEKKVAKELKRKLSKSDKILSEKITKAMKEYNKHGAKKLDDENSYEGFYTNVVKMEKYLDLDVNEKEPEYDQLYKTYVEGAGSIDFEGDQKLGYAFAICKSGIRKKVKKGIEDVIDQISENIDKTLVIEQLTFDVFGFSRGAAEARNFIHEALVGDENTSIATQLIDKGYIVNTVDVSFAGLYDTVSTYGLWVAFGAADNVEELNLDSIKSAKQVVQLASADEHREYFSLTNINSASNGIEIYLPGVHSDIGGGYRDFVNENNQEIYFSFRKDYAERDCDELIENGWYKKEHLSIKNTSFNEEYGDEEYSVYATRLKIRNGYSLIPLHIMAGYARKNNIKLKPRLERSESIPSSLKNVDKEIKSYISKVGKKKSKPEDWTPQAKDWEQKKSWVQDLRREYCHFSAKMKMGHTPRVSFWEGIRHRKIYHG